MAWRVRKTKRITTRVCAHTNGHACCLPSPLTWSHTGALASPRAKLPRRCIAVPTTTKKARAEILVAHPPWPHGLPPRTVPLPALLHALAALSGVRLRASRTVTTLARLFELAGKQLGLVSEQTRAGKQPPRRRPARGSAPTRQQPASSDVMSRRAGHMSGLGKKSGLGKASKRHRGVLRDNIQGVTKPAIRRLARRGGVKRMNGLVYEEVRGVLKVFLENIIRDAITYTVTRSTRTATACPSWTSSTRSSARAGRCSASAAEAPSRARRRPRHVGRLLAALRQARGGRRCWPLAVLLCPLPQHVRRGVYQS
jgi:histone H4